MQHSFSSSVGISRQCIHLHQSGCVFGLGSGLELSVSIDSEMSKIKPGFFSAAAINNSLAFSSHKLPIKS